MGVDGGQPPKGTFKRIIACCDGTWMNSLNSKDTVPPSNVTRISRVISRTCHDGTQQVILYSPGIGTNQTWYENFTGGAFAAGLDATIRVVYNFICTNYVDGDEIILIGFSRGAFTARSVADMIASLGLLTPEGMDFFHDIFQDYENMENRDWKFAVTPDGEKIPALAAKGAEKDIRASVKSRRQRYREGLVKLDYARDKQRTGAAINIKAVGVWDTVGSLGIPPISWLGTTGSAEQWKFTSTDVSARVEHAFQALALDEPRGPFAPALWERAAGCATDLRQVWFPGNHANVGGGWPNQSAADLTLAWMCDQLASVGVEFSFARLRDVFMDGLEYAAAVQPAVSAAGGSSWSGRVASWWKRKTAPPLPWACEALYHAPPAKAAPASADSLPAVRHHPGHHSACAVEPLWKTARPWGLGPVNYPTSKAQLLAGTTVRLPGQYRRVDPADNSITAEPLLRTAERIHSSVRVRLAAQGLGLDDAMVWDCKSLLPYWRLQQVDAPDGEEGPVPAEFGMPDAYPQDVLYAAPEKGKRWVWVWRDGEHKVVRRGELDMQIPQMLTLEEEPLAGYWERYLLKLTMGEPDVWRWAEEHPALAIGKEGEHSDATRQTSPM